MGNKTKRSSSSKGLGTLQTELAARNACEVSGARPVSAELAEFIELTRPDASAAHECVGALLEMLYACPPGHKVSAGGLAALLALVEAYMANVVDGLAAGAATA